MHFSRVAVVSTSFSSKTINNEYLQFTVELTVLMLLCRDICFLSVALSRIIVRRKFQPNSFSLTNTQYRSAVKRSKLCCD